MGIYRCLCGIVARYVDTNSWLHKAVLFAQERKLTMWPLRDNTSFYHGSGGGSLPPVGHPSCLPCREIKGFGSGAPWIFLHEPTPTPSYQVKKGTEDGSR
jgi:hypothetical protein